MRILAALTLVLTVALAGCGGEDPPPSPSPSPSAETSTPTPTAPALPDEAKRDTKAGAVAFVRHYVDLINHAQSTGDVAALRAVEDERCKSCRDGRRYIAKIYSSGGSIEGGAWKIKSMGKPIANPATDGFNVDTLIHFGQQTVHRATGHHELRGGSLVITFFLARATHGWAVREWTRSE